MISGGSTNYRIITKCNILAAMHRNKIFFKAIMSAKTDRQENKVIGPSQSALADSNDYTGDHVSQKRVFHMGNYNLRSLKKDLNPRKTVFFINIFQDN